MVKNYWLIFPTLLLLGQVLTQANVAPPAGGNPSSTSVGKADYKNPNPVPNPAAGGNAQSNIPAKDPKGAIAAGNGAPDGKHTGKYGDRNPHAELVDTIAFLAKNVAATSQKLSEKTDALLKHYHQKFGAPGGAPGGTPPGSHYQPVGRKHHGGGGGGDKHHHHHHHDGKTPKTQPGAPGKDAVGADGKAKQYTPPGATPTPANTPQKGAEPPKVGPINPPPLKAPEPLKAPPPVAVPGKPPAAAVVPGKPPPAAVPGKPPAAAVPGKPPGTGDIVEIPIPDVPVNPKLRPNVASGLDADTPEDLVKLIKSNLAPKPGEENKPTRPLFACPEVTNEAYKLMTGKNGPCDGNNVEALFDPNNCIRNIKTMKFHGVAVAPRSACYLTSVFCVPKDILTEDISETKKRVEAKYPDGLPGGMLSHLIMGPRQFRELYKQAKGKGNPVMHHCQEVNPAYNLYEAALPLKDGENAVAIILV